MRLWIWSRPTPSFVTTPISLRRESVIYALRGRTSIKVTLCPGPEAVPPSPDAAKYSTLQLHWLRSFATSSLFNISYFWGAQGKITGQNTTERYWNYSWMPVLKFVVNTPDVDPSIIINISIYIECGKSHFFPHYKRRTNFCLIHVAMFQLSHESPIGLRWPRKL